MGRGHVLELSSKGSYEKGDGLLMHVKHSAQGLAHAELNKKWQLLLQRPVSQGKREGHIMQSMQRSFKENMGFESRKSWI